MPNSTVPAAATGLPNHRRTFLRQLVSLPLIGGGIALIGEPTGVATQPTLKMMEAYKTWLHYEHRLLASEISRHPDFLAYYEGCTPDQALDIADRAHVHPGRKYHRYDGSAPASDRAALVLSAVGYTWSEV